MNFATLFFCLVIIMSRFILLFAAVFVLVLSPNFSCLVSGDVDVSVDPVIPPIYGSYHPHSDASASASAPVVHPQRDVAYYALLLSSEATNCEQKKHPHVHRFITTVADAYSGDDAADSADDRLQVLVTGHSPRLQFFSSAEHRRANIVDGTTMSEDDILARLTATDKTTAPPLGEVELSGMTVADIQRALEFWGIRASATDA